ncbi:MAG: Biotin synthase [Elusimicrobia bacterium ADurb.Bin231]|nr:MAG: Biotin synthase [Elusimicrobia bacterium ADurb.Bin231]
MNINTLLKKRNFDKNDIVNLLSVHTEADTDALLKAAYRIKLKYVGNKVYYRGLIEFSNICRKNCYYCGIRSGNSFVSRYNMPNHEIYKCAKFAYDNNYGSIVLQAGERNDKRFIEKVTTLIKGIKKLGKGKLGITLSVGEQTEETLRKFFNSGAHRYLLRIETSNPCLYKRLHPADHVYEIRKKCLQTLSKIGYQVGTGIMVGLPFQTIENIANDLLFFREIDADMFGLGPYIEHKNTPIIKYKNQLWNKNHRFNLTLKIIAVLRIMMKDVNIAATTALQALDIYGREQGLLAGANVIMPNLTPIKYRNSYLLYEGKPCLDEGAEECQHCLEQRIKAIGEKPGYNEWGDSPHFAAKHRYYKKQPD